MERQEGKERYEREIADVKYYQNVGFVRAIKGQERETGEDGAPLPAAAAPSEETDNPTSNQHQKSKKKQNFPNNKKPRDSVLKR